MKEWISIINWNNTHNNTWTYTSCNNGEVTAIIFICKCNGTIASKVHRNVNNTYLHIIIVKKTTYNLPSFIFFMGRKWMVLDKKSALELRSANLLNRRKRILNYHTIHFALCGKLDFGYFYCRSITVSVGNTVER